MKEMHIIKGIRWLFNKSGIEFRWFQKYKKDHALLQSGLKRLTQLEQQYKEEHQQALQYQNHIHQELQRLTKMFIEKEINDMRWEIIHFASAIAEGRPCNQDSYQHCLHVFEKYKKILQENNMTNGEVDISMDIIQTSYKKKLIDGF